MAGFKDFVLRGNVVDLAVGVIVGAAFGKIVTTLVEGIITGHPTMPEFRLDPGQARDVISYLKTLER